MLHSGEYGSTYCVGLYFNRTLSIHSPTVVLSQYSCWVSQSNLITTCLGGYRMAMSGDPTQREGFKDLQAA